MAYGWYVARVKRGKVTQAQALLSLQGLEVCYPRLLVPRQSQTHTEDLFPGYLFCRLDPSCSQHWPEVLWTPCLRYFLPQNAPPMPLSDHAMEDIRRRVERWNEGGYTQVYQKGDRLRIRSGALRGLDAIFQGYLPAKERCEAFLDWFGRQLLTTIDLADVELSPESKADRAWVPAYQRIHEPSTSTDQLMGSQT